MKLNWDDIRILLALVRSGSFTRASLVLEMDQSTVGRRLSSLERSLGAILFVRSKSGLIPTDAGERIIADAMEIERRTERIQQAAAARDNEPIGELCLMGDHWVLQHLATHFLPSLITSYPKLSVRLVSKTDDVASRTAATVSLRFEDPPQLGEFAIKLVDVAFALYADKRSNEAPDRWVSIRDSFASRRAPVALTDKLRKRNEPVLVLADDPGLLQVPIECGIGKGLLPVCIAQGNAALQRIGDEKTELLRRLHLHAHPDTVQSHRVQTVIRRLREDAEELFAGQLAPA
ncbi:LysR family transcriptional regulator [uncultured Roseibium sp.]|uniref:LysR family transcriptional regulator n=1 Tax=uncultured Roseibium sp. TaxID=1936171 RepID=UPI002619035E|nr:LysR family transcriptional regulator [uncultured Roseibium sp.]